MAMQVTKTLQVKRDNNTNVFPAPLTASKPTGAECDADLAAQVAAKVAAAQDNVAELTAVAAII